VIGAVERAREAYARRDWSAALAGLSDAARDEPLAAADHERAAVCAYLIGDDDACERAWESAQRVAQDAGDHAGAARGAFWLAMCLMMRGQMARAGGWLTRAHRLVERAGGDCAAAGYVLIPEFLGALDGGDPERARDLAVRAAEVGDRFDDADLRAFATLAHGQALLAMGDVVGGTARLDEVMVSVTADEVGPITTGIVYCAVVLECMQRFDLARAAEWTDALDAWCAVQPDLVPYRGQCLVHRSQLQQAAGEWPEALTSAAAASARLADPPHPALGLAHYQEAELHRLVGDLDAAEAEYQAASRYGHDPMPGLALLELVRGDAATAATSIRRALHDAGPANRPAVLAAAVDVLRAVNDAPGARAAADELAAIASAGASDVLAAMAAYACGAVDAMDGEVSTALTALRAADASWQALHMPYEAARTAVLLGLTCLAFGDERSATLELDRARRTFTTLGAAPDLERLEVLTSDGRAVGGASLLSPREREVLAHVAAGETNRQIAEALVISQHTVGRHLENIFAKLGVTSRAAATAYAYEHDLL
jgi:DNA-binding CsgD family transcriptional regulator/tetratricopeptide (TPR) repeat protein